MNSSSIQRETPPSGLRGASPAAGCSSSSAPCRCAGTSRTRSDRTSAHPVEPLVEHHVERLGALDGLQHERAARSCRVTSTSTPRAPSPRRTAGSSSAFSVSLTVRSSPVAVTSVARDDLRREAAEPERPCRACRSRWRPRSSAGRCRPCSASRGRRARAGAAAGAGGCRRRASPGRSRHPTSITPERSVRSSCTPGATAMPVKL